MKQKYRTRFYKISNRGGMIWFGSSFSAFRTFLFFRLHFLLVFTSFIFVFISERLFCSQATLLKLIKWQIYFVMDYSWKYSMCMCASVCCVLYWQPGRFGWSMEISKSNKVFKCINFEFSNCISRTEDFLWPTTRKSVQDVMDSIYIREFSDFNRMSKILHNISIA